MIIYVLGSVIWLGGNQQSKIVLMGHSQGVSYLLGKKLRNLKSSWPLAAEDRRLALGMAWPSLQTTIHVPASNLS